MKYSVDIFLNVMYNINISIPPKGKRDTYTKYALRHLQYCWTNCFSKATMSQ